MRRIPEKETGRSRKEISRFTDLLDTKSFGKSDYHDYVQDS